MTLTFAESLDRTAVVHAAGLVAELVSRPAVAAAWRQESSCAGMTVGGLTWHLVGQPVHVVTLLAADGRGVEGETIDVLEHYARAAWVRQGPDGAVNRVIRETADRQAREGVGAAVGALAAARGRLDSVLADPPAVTYVPWQGWSLGTDDFLVTRLMEMVVHADDLAASVGVAGPTFPESVLDPVFRLLAALAVRRHGQDALVRALTRPQRAPDTVSAF